MQEDSSALLFDGDFEKHISETVNDYNMFGIQYTGYTVIIGSLMFPYN
jgi:hypothetical protein